ncbi:unnamed protein product [Dovyalis caffra]|uniref:Uncharacterized protein n=1 Tax=Dovyalis caffra TaxID=77055 RepID=A0AAV1REW3_9ROSI|nr:unnamed protein product [Dovyalis caffra]
MGAIHTTILAKLSGKGQKLYHEARNIIDRVDTSSPIGVLEDYHRSEESESCSSKEPISDEAT